jgi:hypothetical protein
MFKDDCVDQIGVEEGGLEQIDDEEEHQSSGVGVEQNSDPGGSGEDVEVEALLRSRCCIASWRFPRGTEAWIRNHDFWIAAGTPWWWRHRGVIAAHPSIVVSLECSSVDQEQQFQSRCKSSVEVEV